MRALMGRLMNDATSAPSQSEAALAAHAVRSASGKVRNAKIRADA